MEHADAAPIEAARSRILAAALLHVAFDGWSDKTLRAAARDAEIDEATARLAFPRGGVDLALYFHEDGDRRLAQALAAAPLGGMKMRERVAFAVRKRLDLAAGDREAVRRAATLFSLPIHAADGAKALWRTADTIWTGLGDASTDGNWYSKRGILTGVYGATVLYWLGDASEGFQNTWAFLDRRIEGVMRFEKLKAQMNGNPVGRALMAGPNFLASLVKAPTRG